MILSIQEIMNELSQKEKMQFSILLSRIFHANGVGDHWPRFIKEGIRCNFEDNPYFAKALKYFRDKVESRKRYRKQFVENKTILSTVGKGRLVNCEV